MLRDMTGSNDPAGSHAVSGDEAVGVATPDIDHLASFPITLDDPPVVRGTRVTHLTSAGPR